MGVLEIPLLLLTASAILASVLVSSQSRGPRDDCSVGSGFGQFSNESMVKLSPTHEVREGVDVVWQIPPNPKGVLYLAHSANGSPFSYWPSHPTVPQCLGTPEHRVAVEQALKRGFAVIAGKSVTREWETWPPTTIDIDKAVKILNGWRAEHGLEHLPLSAWGTSCGGDYVSGLAAAINMHSLVIMISKGHSKALESAEPGVYPATLWVPMIKDTETFEIVKKNLEIFKKKGIPAAIVEAPPLKVHPLFFSEYIEDINEEQSKRLHSVLVDYGVLDKDNGVKKILLEYNIEPYLRKADLLPTEDEAQRQKDEEAMKSAGDEGPPLGGRGHGGEKKRDKPPPPKGSVRSTPLDHFVSNQLRVAEGRHTLTSRHNSKIFDWLEGKGWPNVQPQ